MSGWIPKEICSMDEFLPENLKPLRDYVRKERGEDISVALHVFEERVLFSLPQNSELEAILSELWGTAFEAGGHRLGWETIRIYEHETEYSVKKFEIEKRRVKRYFLRGWMEVGMWERGLGKKQEIYPAPAGEDADEREGMFFYGEPARLSLDAMQNYRNYLNLKPKERPPKPRFINQKLSAAKENTWHVFVTGDLRQYYYEAAEAIQNPHSAKFPPLPKDMTTINCLKNNETGHAAVANYDSWQTFLHALNTERGNTMNPENTVLEEIRELQKEAVCDLSPILPEIKAILKRISTDTRLSELSKNDQDKIRQASQSSPKVRLLLRMGQLKFIRSKTAEYLAEKTRPNEDTHTEKLSDISNTLVKWLSPLWEPQWAGMHVSAGDIPEQKHRFRMKEGEIEISCRWRSPHGNTPAYVQVSWAADITTDCEFWLLFINPGTKAVLSEVFLGTALEGGKIITSKTLGFDPSAEPWAASVLLKERTA